MIETAIEELERAEQNKKILIDYIINYPGTITEKERLINNKTRILKNIYEKKSISIKNLVDIAKKLKKSVVSG